MRVLVTGGTGTLGKAVIRKLLGKTGTEFIVSVSRNEAEQVRLSASSEFRTDKLIFAAGDIRNRDLMLNLMRVNKISHVVHTAALKHVPICEKQPSECMSINVEGSRNILQAASESGVQRVVMVSTDKAAQPMNAYGLSKALMERLMNEYDGKMGVNCTRFGNLVGSKGSVFELFLQQARENGTVTVTDPEMTRFFIRISQAADVVHHALGHLKSGLVFVPQMRAAVLSNFVQAVFEYARIHPKIQVIGARPGERKHEMLVSEEEAFRSVQIPEFSGLGLGKTSQDKPFSRGAINSSTAPKMPVDELVSMLQEIDKKLERI